MGYATPTLGMQTVTQTLIDSLLDLEPGQPITLNCQTSTVNVLLKSSVDERLRRVPQLNQLAVIPYIVQGKFISIEEVEKYAFVKLSTVGEAAVLSSVNGRLKVVDVETREKITHVPISAIRKVIQH